MFNFVHLLKKLFNLTDTERNIWLGRGSVICNNYVFYGFRLFSDQPERFANTTQVNPIHMNNLLVDKKLLFVVIWHTCLCNSVGWVRMQMLEIFMYEFLAFHCSIGSRCPRVLTLSLAYNNYYMHMYALMEWFLVSLYVFFPVTFFMALSFDPFGQAQHFCYCICLFFTLYICTWSLIVFVFYNH